MREPLNPLFRLALLALLGFGLGGAVSSVRAGSSGQIAASGIEAQAEFEIARRRELASDFAPQAMQRGTEALAVRDYEKAFSEYRAALDAIPNAPEVRDLHQVALDGFTKAAMGLAEQRIAEGRWKDAETTVLKLLEPQYNPNYQPARRLLQRLESPDYFNKTVTPGFVSRVEQVKKFLVEAQGLYDSGRFALAMEKYEEVLAIDRYNIAARRGMEQVDLARTRVAEAGYNDTRASMITDVDRSWEMPLRRNGIGVVSMIDQGPIERRGTAEIKSRMAKTRISVNFVDRTIRQAFSDIQQQAPDINIVFKGAPESEAQTITLALDNVPVSTALDYVTKFVNLKYKIEPYAVLIVPPDAVVEEMVVKTFNVGPNFMKDLPGSSESQTSDAGTEGTVVGINAKSALEANGVIFPAGAMAEFIPSTSKLIVKNTRENMDLVDRLVESLAPEGISQVEIESKFVEVTQNNLKELGFDWLLGQFGFPGGSGIYGGGGTVGNQLNNSQNFPFNYPGTGPAGDQNNPLAPVGINPVTAGNRTGAAAITANAVDALLLGNPVTGPATGVLALAGVFSNPQFQVVLRALNQAKGIDVLSAPRVTTKSGQSATIEIVREFRYPEEYDPPQIPQSTGVGRQPITPATPTTFQMKPVGVTLAVVPNVDTDKSLIDLELKPTVNEFEGFINYGSPILNRGVVVTENVINYPVFSQRTVETTVSLFDGQVAVIGGLMREDVQKVSDKTPILGDIPLAGALFRSQADQHIKRNLIIFVQASLVDPAGQPLATASLLKEDMAMDAGLSPDPSLTDGASIE